VNDLSGKLIAGVVGAGFVVGFGWLGASEVRDYRR
jgi:hypothetical protein